MNMLNISRGGGEKEFHKNTQAPSTTSDIAEILRSAPKMNETMRE